MEAICVYEGHDGVTHFEDMGLPTHAVADGIYQRTGTLAAADTMFAIQPPGFFAD